MPGEPRKHHYVPQCLLRNFTHDGRYLYNYDFHRGRIYSNSTLDAGCERNLYTHKMASGEDFRLEYMLANVDGAGCKAIKKLVNHEKLGTDWNDFLFFVAVQLVRTPAHLQVNTAMIQPMLHESAKRIVRGDKRLMQEFQKLPGMEGKTTVELETAFHEILGGFQPTKEFVQCLTFQTAVNFTSILQDMRWQILTLDAADPDLIIGDHPVLLNVGPGDLLGLKNPNLVLEIPLSKRVAAVAKWDGPISFGTFYPGAAQAINASTIRFARRFIFAPFRSDAVLTYGVAAKGTGPAMTTKVINTPAGGTLVVNEWRDSGRNVTEDDFRAAYNWLVAEGTLTP